MGIKMSTAFPSKYLKAVDLEEQEVVLTIEHIEIDMVGKEQKQKPVVYFKEREKGLVLNKSNANKIVAEYGDDSAGWTGKKIVLFQAWVDFQGETVEAIRVRIPTAKPIKRAAAVHNESNPPPFDDEIPS